MSAERHQPGTRPDRGREAAALIVALHSLAEDVRRAELARAQGCWAGLGPRDRRRLEILTQDLVDALLDEPTARLRAGDCVEDARWLFGLEAREEDGRRPAVSRRSAFARVLEAGPQAIPRTGLAEA
ncbi:hypothetical protein [Miltoncostaea marina]|uniref:hypothetical protein n=1 Tax=Miltoncostaea marina TaxID=2843215 RepID=UPI001C3E2433|nr:hypothetical protein [Miltoncostaea marina]